jgi:hypothetical protein
MKSALHVGSIAAATLACLLGPQAGAAPTAAQSLLQRIEAVPDGTVRLSFAVRPGVCSDGDRVEISRGTAEWAPDRSCSSGPGLAALDLRDHRIVALRVHFGGRWRALPGVVADLGRVPAAQAAAAFLQLARQADGTVAERAVVPAALADSAVVWPQLLQLARDDARPLSVRRNATFWLSQQAAEAATRGLADIAQQPGQREVRRAAVFALSQRPHDEGVPVLIHIARTADDPDIRRQAIFWLGQTGDPRALDFIRELLAAR